MRRQRLLAFKIAVVALCASGTASVARAQVGSVQLRSQERGRIRGVAFDSLKMLPFSNAKVILLDGAQSDTPNRLGQFELKDVPPGSHTVAITSPELDSLGLGTLGTTIVMPAGGDVRINLAVPSFRTIWSYRCANTPALSPDSGIVWGTIRDASTKKQLSSASAQFEWYDVVSTPAVALHNVRKEIGTDTSGLYVACGVPTDIRLASLASAPGAASGQVEFQVGLLRLQRMDMLVSADMVIPDTMHFQSRNDSLLAERARGEAMLRGIVLDYRQKPMANAVVRVANLDTVVRTNKNGRFTLGGLPSGTHEVEVRRIGYAPFTQIVHLQPDSALELRVQMPDVSALTTINVRATTSKGTDRLAYETRRAQGRGAFIEPRAMGRQVDIATMLAMVPNIRITRAPDGLNVWVGNDKAQCTEPFLVFLDGILTNWRIVYMRVPDKYRAIEVYTNASDVPRQYSAGTDTCGGAAFFWLNNAHW